MAKYVLLEQLGKFKRNVEAAFVEKERKTGSATEFKVLSDNNLTDELVGKIDSAGDSDFSGAYADLTGKPTINGKSVEGDLTAASLGVATPGDVASAKAEALSAIDTAVSTAYKVKGSVAFAALPAPSKTALGDVYNVSDAFATTDTFVEGAGKSYPAGTNVVCANASGSTYKWDVLAGFVDLSGYVKLSDIEFVTDAEIDAMFNGS